MKTTATATTVSIRRSEDRGHAHHGWLETHHSFSFGDYYDPEHMGYRSLRVINDDLVAPGAGFPTHPHRSMEIFTYVISGQLEHKDSMGNGRVIKAGEFQYMSAASGVQHSEFNPSADEPVHLLQIWITPEQTGGEPRYADMDANRLKQPNGLALLASPDGRDGSMQIRQQAEIHFGQLDAGRPLAVPPAELGGAWIHVIKGGINIQNATLSPGDSAAVDDSANGFPVAATKDAEFLLFRLA